MRHITFEQIPDPSLSNEYKRNRINREIMDTLDGVNLFTPTRALVVNILISYFIEWKYD